MGNILTNLFSPSDEQAMWRVQTQNDSQAFAQLLRKWEGPIKNLCLRMLGDAHKAEDLTQETFARIFAKRADYRPEGKFSTFLWRVALNICYDELRRISRRKEIAIISHDDSEGSANLEDTFVSREESPDQQMEREERASSVRGALMKLPEHYRSVVVLKHYENLKFREIAEVLGIPEGTVKSRMAEGLKLLHDLLRSSLKKENFTCKTIEPRKELLVL